MRLLLSLTAWVTLVHAWQVYQPKNQVIFGGSALNLTASLSPTGTAARAAAFAASYTAAAENDTTTLTPPAVPNPPVPTSIPVQLPSSGGIPNLSAKVNGAFFGFSIEMSVANQVIGKNSTLVQVAFLNLMQNIAERVGWVQVRVGGNTQESAEFVSSLPNGTILAKDLNNTSGPTGTPPLEYTVDLFYLLGNVSKLTNVHWYLGIPFINATPSYNLAIIQQSQPILGDYLLSFQSGNEPDLYADHGHRPSTYSQSDYFGEIGNLVQQIANDPLIVKKDNLLIVPSVQVLWTPESVWNTGIVAAYSSSINSLAVERYPDDNCALLYPALGETVQNPQDIFINYLQHNASTNLVQSYLNSSAFAAANDKPFIMFETNSASCSGFEGISDSYGGGLWALDWALTMAYSNFTAALFHVGGQNSYYNPFTAPPTNTSSWNQFSVGPVYYSALIMAELMGPHNTSQISDITTNINTPIYAIFENGAPTKLALFNYVSDATGASTYSATISIGGGTTGQSNATPAQIQVKYFLAESAASRTGFTWAGQTLGGVYQVDGRLSGELNVTTIQCDTTANTCSVPVPAPGFALVFLTSDALSAVSPSSTKTFATSTQTRTQNTIYIDPAVLQTSYGHSGMENVRGATSAGSSSASSMMRDTLPGALVLLTAALGAIAVARRW